MDMQFRDEFIRIWQRYFNNAELPVACYYTDEAGHADLVKPGTQPYCLIGALAKVRRGASFTFNEASVGCPGGQTYLGFGGENVRQLEAELEYFLSCGIPGQFAGERFKKSPEIVREQYGSAEKFEAPNRYVVFKRWDSLEATDNPRAVIFFARPDVLAGLYNLANFDTADHNAVIAPWRSGCASIVKEPFLESLKEHPRAVLGMFDTAARPFIAADELAFSVPMSKFIRMVGNAEESFLTTSGWKAVQKRIK